MKYQLFYVYETRKEGGGEWWPIAFSLLSISMAFFQVVTFLSLATIAGVDTPPAIYVTILPFITFVFWFSCMKYFLPKTKYLRDSRMIDELKSVPCAMEDPAYSKELFTVRVDGQYVDLWERLNDSSDTSVSDSLTLQANQQ
jgi:hypothetical protein